MQLLTPIEGFLLLALFGVFLCSVVWVSSSRARSAEGFLAAERKVSVFQGSLSIAAAWVWAPAVFICSQQAYQAGLPGIFWFTLPNVLCFFLYAPLAIRMRKRLPKGYTLPDFIAARFPDSRLPHIAFLLTFFGYQIGAILINSLAGGALLHAVSGIDQTLAICVIAAIAMGYTLVSGLKASILTDVIQMLMVLVLCVILVPLCLWKGGGFAVVSEGLGGVAGNHRSLFDPWIAFSMGIPMTLGLLAGPINDQMFWQRAVSVRERDIFKTFAYGGLLFALVPILLSMLGFLGAGMVRADLLSVADPQLVGPTVIGSILPKVALYGFCLMALAGLCSTMDSACCAVSSLGAVDIYRRYLNPAANDRQIVRASRISILVSMAIGISLALLGPKLLWCFLIYGALASAGLFPAIFSLLSTRVTSRAVGSAVLLGFFVGLPYSIYANVMEAPVHIVLSSILSVSIGLVICSVSAIRNRAESIVEQPMQVVARAA